MWLIFALISPVILYVPCGDERFDTGTEDHKGLESVGPAVLIGRRSLRARWRSPND